MMGTTKQDEVASAALLEPVQGAQVAPGHHHEKIAKWAEDEEAQRNPLPPHTLTE